VIEGSSIGEEKERSGLRVSFRTSRPLLGNTEDLYLKRPANVARGGKLTNETRLVKGETRMTSRLDVSTGTRRETALVINC
jgi:hypothetical protein